MCEMHAYIVANTSGLDFMISSLTDILKTPYCSSGQTKDKQKTNQCVIKAV